MPRQVTLQLVGLVAAVFRAGEGPRGGVGESVLRQLPLRPEGHVAAVFQAGEGPRGGVDDSVLRQLPLRPEGLVAAVHLTQRLTRKLLPAKGHHLGQGNRASLARHAAARASSGAAGATSRRRGRRWCTSGSSTPRGAGPPRVRSSGTAA